MMIESSNDLKTRFDWHPIEKFNYQIMYRAEAV
jgi:hypothetical protein